jgi:hypothetical protein
MPCRGPRITSMLTVLVACWTAIGADAHAQGLDLERDPARFVATLRERGLVTPALRPQIEAVIAVLAAQVRQWPRAHVNGPYDPDALNLYLIDTAAGANLPDSLDRLRGTLGRLRGTLLALPRQRMILADADYLAQVKAAADLSWASTSRAEPLVSHFEALALTQFEGPDAAVRSRLGPSADWRRGTNELFDGAAAFLIAHEMAHVLAGLNSALEGPVRRPSGLQGRDADRFWACANLVGEKITGTRRQEAEADQFAALLLATIPHPSPPRRLRFELGALFLLNAELGKAVLTIMSLNPNAPALAARAGLRLNDTLVRAMTQTLGRGDGFIQTVFPDSHPARVDRLLDVAGIFARTPASAWYGDQDNTSSQQLWQLLIQAMCQSIRPQQ